MAKKPKATATAEQPKPKIPRALKSILDNAKPAEPPPDNKGIAAVMAKGIASHSLEAGQGAGAIMAISNDGPAVQVSMSTPFGRPALEPGQVQQVPVPLLEPETDEEKAEAAANFESAWSAIAEAAPEQEIIEEEPPVEEEEMDPFAAAPTEEEVEMQEDLQAAFPESESPAEIEADPELLEEIVSLRKANQGLREEINVLGNKNGAKAALDALKLEREKSAQLEEQLAASGGAGLPEWKGKQLQVCFPCYKTTNPATAFCLLALALDFGRDKIGFLPSMGDARMANVRNRLAHLYMATGAEWMLQLDDDMIPTIGRPELIRSFIGATEQEVPDSVLGVHVVQRLMSHNQKLIGATYFGRRKNSPAMFKDGIDNRNAYDKAKRHTGELIPTEWVATGCLLVHRDVFLGIQKAHPELAPAGSRVHWDYFREGAGETEGEDVMFCKRAKKAGFQAFVDTGAQCFHVGALAYGFHNTTNPLLAGINRPGGIQDRETAWFK